MYKTYKKIFQIFLITHIIVLYINFIYSCHSFTRNDRTIFTNTESRISLDSIKRIWNRLNITGQNDSIIILTRPYFRASVLAGDTNAVLCSGVSIAQSFLIEEQADSVKHYIDMIDSYEKGNSDAILGIILNNIKGNYAIKYELDYAKALELFQEAYLWATKINDLNNQVIMLANMVNIFYIRSDSHGMKYAEKAVSLANAHDLNNLAICLAELSMGQMTLVSGKYDLSLKYLEEASYLSGIHNIKLVEPIIFLLYGDIYAATNKPDKADYFYNKALEPSIKPEPSILSKIYLNYGSLCEKEGKFHKAIDIYKKGLTISYEYNNMEFRGEILHKLSDLYYLTGDREESLKFYQKYRHYSDSTNNKSREVEFNNLLLSYQKMEHEHEMQSKEIALMKANRKNWIISFILVAVGILSILLAYLYTRKQRMYRTLVIQHQNFSQRLEHNIPPSQDNNDRILFNKLEKEISKEEIYTMKDLSLDKIAEIIGSNRTYVSKAINKFSGMTFYSFLDMYRIREATRIISDPLSDITFKQLADKLGYNSVSVFYKAFHKETGCTPGQYRDQIRKLKKEKAIENT